MKSNIWIINHYATAMYFDEGGRHYWFAKNLKKNGYNPVVFCSSEGHNGGKGIDLNGKLYLEKFKDGIKYVFVKTKKYNSNGSDRILNMYSFYSNLLKIYKKLENKPDVVLASSVHPLTLLAGLKIAKKLNISCICEVRDLWPESLVAYGALDRENIVTKILYAKEKYIYRKADAVIMTWKGGKQYIIDQSWDDLIDLNKVFHISNGVQLEDYYTKVSDDYYDIDLDNRKVNSFVYTGSIRKVNNIEKLVDAAKIIGNNKNIQILIYGDGDEREKLEKKIKEQNIENIKFKGRVPKKDIPSILAKSYVNILHNSSTSLDRYGSSQNKLFEYLASGKCILQTYSTNHNVINEGKSGITLEKQTPEDIAEAILYLNENAEVVSKMGINAKQSVTNFDFEVLTKQLIDVINFVK
ncbi:glycosyltransferase family 4 protein [Aerococcus urinaeequi]|uniref:glycosyltransferase family 4 protein n=1 Tax=Aerococcus urinaeequi TaxID=51665 RepID=UPI0022E9778A|nr:glycosyltransferase family 4 protein [Aerococcus urinaeequi]